MLPPMEVALRLDRLRARLDGAGCDALLVTSTTNIGYLTGFTGSAGLLWVAGKLGDDGNPVKGYGPKN